MRINQFVAHATGLSRRAVDKAILDNRISVNDVKASIGQNVDDSDTVSLDSTVIKMPKFKTVLLINKPVGIVSSRKGQGSRTIYDVIPPKYHNLKPVGRLDKDSSGLLILTNDGELSYKISHPSFNTEKVYIVTLEKTLNEEDKEKIETGKILLDNRPSIMRLKNLNNHISWEVVINEGRNRQIRRTFEKLNNNVSTLHRIRVGKYSIDSLGFGDYLELD